MFLMGVVIIKNVEHNQAISVLELWFVHHIKRLVRRIPRTGVFLNGMQIADASIMQTLK